MNNKDKKTQYDWRHSLTREHIGTVFLTCLPAIVMMVVIFCFSSSPADKSSQTSSVVVDFIIDSLKRLNIVSLNVQETALLAERLSFPVRKLAHMAEFGVLSWCMFLCIYNIVRWYPYIPAFFCTFFYACTDEFHQTFVTGRAGRITDVLVDSTGAFIALLVLHFILCLRNKKNRKMQDKQDLPKV